MFEFESASMVFERAGKDIIASNFKNNRRVYISKVANLGYSVESSKDCLGFVGNTERQSC